MYYLLFGFQWTLVFQPITALAAFLHRLYSYTSSRLYPCKTYQMGSSGLEPPTSRLSGARSNLLSYEPPTGLDPCSHIFQLGRWVLTRSFTLAYSISSMKFALALRILFSSLLRFRACPVKAIGLSVSLAWWRWWDSNPWPPACRAGALPTELHPHVGYPSSSYFVLLLLQWTRNESRT